MAILIKVDGTRKEVQPRNGTDFSLEELQDFVDGYIEHVSLPRPFKGNTEMWLNEEGKLIGLPRNEFATILYGCDVIVGDVLICKKNEVL